MMSTPITQTSDRFYRAGGVKDRHTIYFALLAVLIILVSACGKKAPPIPSTYVAPPVVEGLQVVLENHIAKLKWPVPEWEGKNALADFYVYHSRIVLSDAGCENCPVRFKKAKDIRIESNKSWGSYEEPLEKGFRYFFKVSAVTDNGNEGEPSEIVTIDY